MILLMLCSCKTKAAETYTVTSEVGNKKVVSYGVIVCNEIVPIAIPHVNNCQIFCKTGQVVNSGDILASYQSKGKTINLQAAHNGIVCSPKEGKQNIIYYYNLEDVSVSTAIAESDVKYINIGDEVTVKGEGLQKQNYIGVITQLSAAAKKEQNGTFVECTIQIKNPDTSIIPGFSVRIENLIELQDSVKIPITAINYDQKGCYVTILDNKSEKKKYLSEVLFSDGEYTVCTGLNGNEKLLIKQ